MGGILPVISTNFRCLHRFQSVLPPLSNEQHTEHTFLWSSIVTPVNPNVFRPSEMIRGRLSNFNRLGSVILFNLVPASDLDGHQVSNWYFQTFIMRANCSLYDFPYYVETIHKLFGIMLKLLLGYVIQLTNGDLVCVDRKPELPYVDTFVLMYFMG